ncbi:hypothetical protein BZG36_04745 [Bifiguratus adelaidae]|uniref:Aquaporin n=1 Tax=Bifiguratus adelaidae TaxID=1938954 RepID=A0A261XVD7_9FUNG|nr:hypothetical protein BZG36_04745 [Bifiguratus adelaidae]
MARVLWSPTMRNDLVAAAGEFVGMCFFMFLSLGGVQATLWQDQIPTAPTPSQILGVAFSFGFSLLISVWMIFRISGGGVLNPAVLLALLLTGNVTPFRGLLYFIAEMVGSIVGSALLDAVTPGPLLGVNKVSPEINSAQDTFLEAFSTAMLVIVVLFVAVEKSKSTFLAPMAVGFAVFLAHLVCTPYDGTSINPARSVGPAVVTGIWTSQHWIFWIGPLIGSLLSTAIYMLFKWRKYELLLPQAEAETQDPDDIAMGTDDAAKADVDFDPEPQGMGLPTDNEEQMVT